MNKKTIANFIIALISQLLILAFGILIPKFIITSMGSETNGFLSTTNQFFTYIALVEGGLSVALLNSLYKPIHNANNDEISELLTYSQKRYIKISLIYFAISIVVGFIYPSLIKSNELSYWVMFGCIACQGLTGALNIFFSSMVIQFLIASGHGYVKQIVHLIVYTLSSIVKIIAIVLTKNVLIVLFSQLIISLIGAVFYYLYFKKKFPDINLRQVSISKSLLKEKKYFLIHNISSAVFGATDLFVISIFCSLNDASIYSIYALIFTAITTMMSSIFESLKYILGDAYSSGLDDYKRVHDAFDAVHLATMFALFFVAYVLSNGFVGIYTKNSDINYVDEWLPLLFAVSSLLSSCRIVCNNTHNIANRSKQNLPYSIIESVINLSVSLVLVHFIGMYGVIVGTIVALLFRTNQTIIYTNRVILKRNSLYTYKYIIIYSLLFCAGALLFFFVLKPSISDYLEFVVWGLITTLVSFVLFFSACFAMNGHFRRIVSRFLLKKPHNQNN